MKKFIVLFSIIGSFFISPLCAKAFHLLLLGDTKDPSLDLSVMKNIQNVDDTFSYLASVSGVPLHKRKLTSLTKNLTNNHIFNWIKNEDIARDDVVILYYSGHGANYGMGSTMWPFAYFPEGSKQVIEFPKIMEHLFYKKAALYLVILDCCNAFTEPRGLPRTKDRFIAFEIEKFNRKLVAANCQELFFRSNGFIIASAASPGEVAWNDVDISPSKKRGGIFTKVFLNYFFQELHATQPSWRHIFEKAKDESMKETKKSKYQIFIHDPHSYQTPQYKIFLDRNKRSASTYKKYFFKNR